MVTATAAPITKLIIEMFEGKEKAVGYVWEMPEMDMSLFIAVSLMVIGFAMVFLLERRAASK